MIDTIYSQKNRFIVLGLTGSGCTTAAEFLSKTKKEHKIYEQIVSFKDEIDVIQKLEKLI